MYAAYQKVDYRELIHWTPDQLRTRIEEIIHAQRQLYAAYGEAARDAISILSCEYHDMDEELDAQMYYLENPSPTRAEFMARMEANRIQFFKKRSKTQLRGKRK
jgi:hypothetical protein